MATEMWPFGFVRALVRPGGRSVANWQLAAGSGLVKMDRIRRKMSLNH